MLRFLLAALAVTAAFAGCVSDGPVGDGVPPGGSATTTAPRPTDPAPGPQPSPQPGPDPNTTDPLPAPGAPWIWPALDAATIRPGVQVFIEGSQCTSNFVFLDPSNTTVFIGFAAHCATLGDDSTNTDGCDDANEALPLGTDVEVQGADHPASLAYTSWGTMQAAGESAAGACAANDFAFAALHADDAPKAHPAMLTFGGPTGAADSKSVGAGDKVLTFGNTGLRPGPAVLDAREGYVLGQSNGGWTTTVYTVTPGLPGDSGSGVLTGQGRALGILVTVGLTPFALSNGVTSLDRALEYAAAHGIVVELATWQLLDAGILP